MTTRQLKFIEEYLVDFNATRAAISAGYSQKTARAQATRLLTNADVSVELTRRKTEMAESVQLTQKQVLDELLALGFSDVTDYLDILDASELQLKDLSALPKTLRKAISSIKLGKNGLELKLYDKLRALELLGRYTGLFDNKPDTTIQVNNLFAMLDQLSDADFSDEIPELAETRPD